MGKENWEQHATVVYFGDGGIDLYGLPDPVNRARLIASAHDLLEVLIESRLYVEMAAKNCYNPVADNLLSKIDGLIAKARGQ